MASAAEVAIHLELADLTVEVLRQFRRQKSPGDVAKLLPVLVKQPCAAVALALLAKLERGVDLCGDAMVETLDGPVKMKIPAGTQNAQRFRIKGKGVPGKGDLYAETNVEIPKKLDDETKKALEELKEPLGG